jgi:hypothetical protein
VAGLLFWPCQLLWLNRTASVINAPIVAAAKAAEHGPIVVFHYHMQPQTYLRNDSWTFWPPLASSRMDEPVVWAGNWGLHNLDLLKQMPGRRPMLLTWKGAQPELVPWTPELAPPGTDKAPVTFEPKPIVIPQPSLMVVPEGYYPWAATSEPESTE